MAFQDPVPEAVWNHFCHILSAETVTSPLDSLGRQTTHLFRGGASGLVSKPPHSFRLQQEALGCWHSPGEVLCSQYDNRQGMQSRLLSGITVWTECFTFLLFQNCFPAFLSLKQNVCFNHIICVFRDFKGLSSFLYLLWNIPNISLVSELGKAVFPLAVQLPFSCVQWINQLGLQSVQDRTECL